MIGSGSESADFSDSIDCFALANETLEPLGGILALSIPGIEGGAEDSSSDDANSNSRISSSAPTSSPLTSLGVHSESGYTSNVLREKCVCE